MSINWSDPKSLLTPHFTVHDALWLPSWQVYHVPSELEKANIIKQAEKLELVREYLEKPLIIHVWIRPVSVNAPNTQYHLKNYNAAIGGAPGSAHIEGKATDWNPVSMTCSEARTILEPKLEEFKIRMENIDGNWVHTDMRDPLPNKKRFFRP